MTFLVDFAPLALFLAGYLYRDIFFAIIVLMVTMPISLFIKYRLTGKLDKMLLWSTLFLFVFGGVSLWLEDQRFLYWKPTAFYWVLAVAFLASNWIGEKPLVQRFYDLLGEIPLHKMSRGQIVGLNSVWAAFFALAGILNIVVAYRFSEDTWVKFKVFGLTALTIVFMTAQVFWILSKFGEEADDTPSADSSPE